VENKAVFYLVPQGFAQQNQMFGPFGEHQYLSTLLISGRHIVGDTSVAL